MTNNEKNENEKMLDNLIDDRATRQCVTRESHLLFFNIYFPHYVKYPLAEFQKDIFRITEDQSNALACICSFRGSGKSTLVTFSYSLWAILGIQQKKFVVIICQTQAQAKQHMTNLRSELENNKLLRSDLGPFQEEAGGEWSAYSIVFKNTKARITIASIEQSIRGIRHYEHRPDLIILDDVEDLSSTRTLETRDKLQDWFSREVMPLGDVGTRIILIGNLLHEDSLMMRLRKQIEANERSGIFRKFPLLDEKKNCLWPGKFDAPEKIEELRRQVGNELAWRQEYLLEVISDSTKVIFPQWIQYYDFLPKDIYDKARAVFIGIDLAISMKDTADYTSMVTGALYCAEGEYKLYVLANPINRRMEYPQTINTIQELVRSLPFKTEPTLAVEANGFQRIYADQLRGLRFKIKEVHNTGDKRSRLAATSYYIEAGKILFPRQGAEALIEQLTGFGVARHDDLCDAFAMMVAEMKEANKSTFIFSQVNGFEYQIVGGLLVPPKKLSPEEEDRKIKQDMEDEERRRLNDEMSRRW